MERKTFIKTCALACLGGSSFINLIKDIAASPFYSQEGEDYIIEIQKSEFIKRKNKKKTTYKTSVTITNHLIPYPIVIYRNNSDSFKALLLQCTHQGQALNVFGDILECPAHGSIFDQEGHVIEGPAVEQLKEFKVINLEKSIKIILQ